MKTVEIMRSENLFLESHGNGTAYTLYRKESSVFVQGEDAAQFREEMESYEKARRGNASAESVLGFMWDQYSELAVHH